MPESEKFERLVKERGFAAAVAIAKKSLHSEFLKSRSIEELLELFIPSFYANQFIEFLGGMILKRMEGMGATFDEWLRAYVKSLKGFKLRKQAWGDYKNWHAKKGGSILL